MIVPPLPPSFYPTKRFRKTPMIEASFTSFGRPVVIEDWTYILAGRQKLAFWNMRVPRIRLAPVAFMAGTCNSDASHCCKFEAHNVTTSTERLFMETSKHRIRTSYDLFFDSMTHFSPTLN